MEIRKSEKEVYKALDQWQTFCFDAGPGSGKTYTLTKAIEHIIAKNDKLNNRNQHILCITYTNVAKEEVEDRIGKNSEVLVSTIHDFLWYFISSQNILLRYKHKNKIHSVIQNLKTDIKKNPLKSRINDIVNFKRVICSDDFKTVFYESYNEHAKNFKNAIIISYPEMKDYLSNVTNFKKLVTQLLKEVRLENTLNDISKGKGKDISYDPTHNQDRLDHYQISHDTLLEFGKSIISENDILKRLFIDKYPYVLIDEYQDTDSKVIDLFKSVLEYSSNEHKFVIGFFGDSKQSIYEHGIGKLDSNSLDFKNIKEVENRRSCQSIVDVINKIRNDDLKQVSIRKDSGTCEFYESDSSGDYPNKLDFKYGTTAYLFLKNDRIAEARHFKELWLQLKKFPRFRNHINLSNEFFQNDLRNVGWFLRNILNLIDFKIKIENIYTTVKDIQKYVEINKTVTFGELEEFLSKVRKIETTNLALKEYIDSLYKIEGRIKGENIISKAFFGDNESHAIGEIDEQAFDYFYNGQEIDDDAENIQINQFFDLNILEFENWYKYVFRLNNKLVDYYTLHGSKGLEFDNVVVVLQDDFARRKDYFKYFFENYNNERLDIDKKEKYDEARNLLYVACSRAKTNLRVIYENTDSAGTEENIKKIFSKIKNLNCQIKCNN